MKMKSDIISNLPDNVTEKILLHLPMRDAVRTSVLSSKWRYRWATIPDVVFDNMFSKFHTRNSAEINKKIVSVIDRVLLMHLGPIHKFVLSHEEFKATSDIDRWILHLSRSSIEHIVLEFWSGLAYKVPSCLFSCQSLIHLELYNCMLKPPSTFKGFRKLKRLDLQDVSFEEDVLENLISSCPNLEMLDLYKIEGVSCIKINAPKLKRFLFEGSPEDVSYDNILSLAEVAIYVPENVKNNQNQALGDSSNLLKFFVKLPIINVLQLHDFSLKYLAVGIEPQNLPEPRAELRHLSLHVQLTNREDCLVTLCLLSITPNLEDLEITGLAPDPPNSYAESPGEQTVAGMDANFWEDGCWNLTFSKLQRMKITNICEAKADLDFIKFILLNSPVLESMVLKPYIFSSKWELVKKLLCFKRASNQAEIIYIDP